MNHSTGYAASWQHVLVDTRAPAIRGRGNRRQRRRNLHRRGAPQQKVQDRTPVLAPRTGLHVWDTNGVCCSCSTARPSGRHEVAQKQHWDGWGVTSVHTSRKCRRSVIGVPSWGMLLLLLLQSRVILTTWSHLPKVTILVILPNSAIDILGKLHKSKTCYQHSRRSEGPSPELNYASVVFISPKQHQRQPCGRCPDASRTEHHNPREPAPAPALKGQMWQEVGDTAETWTCPTVVWKSTSHVGLSVSGASERPNLLPGSGSFTRRIWFNFSQESAVMNVLSV